MTCRLTCFDLVLQRLTAVLQQLLDGDALLGDVQVQQTPQLLRMVEVDHLLIPVERLLDEVEKDVHHALKEFLRFRITVRVGWQQICEWDRVCDVRSGYRICLETD